MSCLICCGLLVISFSTKNGSPVSYQAAFWLRCSSLLSGQSCCGQAVILIVVAHVSAVKEFIEFLRQRKILPESRSIQKKSALDLVIDEFVRYLLKERGLAATTIKYYREFVREFLRDRYGTAGGVDYRKLKPADILRFVQLRAGRDSSKRVKLLITALRAFFRYLRYKGTIDSNLASVVPSVAQRADSSFPKAILRSQIEQVLSSCKGSTSIERRDHAMFLLLARLGLRAGEVVSLKLDDIDWRDGSISIRGKGGQVTKMPLPIDTGEAIAIYLLEDRPPSQLRSIFLRARAPISYLTVSGLSTRVRLALDALGIETPNCSTHLFRHSLATNMLREGASLLEISELLRHRSTQTTEIYAKVDLVSLRQLALSWPGGEQ